MSCGPARSEWRTLDATDCRRGVSLTARQVHYSGGMSLATVTSMGRVTIPKDVRDALRIRQGDRLVFVVLDDGTVHIRRHGVDVRDLYGMVETDRTLTVEEMDGAIEHHVSREEGA